MDETDTPKKETSISPNSQGVLGPVQPDAPTSALSLMEDERVKAEKIKRVYGALGLILDKKREAKFQREKGDIARVIWPIRAVYLSWIIWLLVFAISPSAVNSSVAQILLIVNILVVLGIYFMKAFNLLKLKKRSAQERMVEDGEKAALEIVFSKRILLEAADEPTLKEVELKQKSDLSLIDSRFIAITNFLKNIIPGAASLVVLFGVPNPTASTSTIGRIFALVAAVVTLIITSSEAMTRRYMIEMKECIAMLEQAQMQPDGATSPPKDVPPEGTLP
jgi:hypothetical protein